MSRATLYILVHVAQYCLLYYSTDILYHSTYTYHESLYTPDVYVHVRTAYLGRPIEPKSCIATCTVTVSRSCYRICDVNVTV